MGGGGGRVVVRSIEVLGDCLVVCRSNRRPWATRDLSRTAMV